MSAADGATGEAITLGAMTATLVVRSSASSCERGPSAPAQSRRILMWIKAVRTRALWNETNGEEQTSRH